MNKCILAKLIFDRHMYFLRNHVRNEVKLVYISCREYADDKSIYQREEEGEKPRMVQGQPYPDWRKPWGQRQGEFKSRLGLFVERNPNPDILNALQKLPKIDLQTIKEWYASMKIIQEIKNQEFLPERVQSLGSNLAAVHFFTYRQGAVRLKDSQHWIVGLVQQMSSLPDHYVEGYQVEAVDCSDFHHNGIRYEGLKNLSGLYFLKWLSLKNQKHIDVWCLDRLAGQNGKTLEYLDISACKLDVGSVFALARMPALRMVIIQDPSDDIPVQAALSFLEEENPNLVIKSIMPNIEKPKISTISEKDTKKPEAR